MAAPSVVNLPESLIKDVLQMYAHHFNQINALNKYDKAQYMKNIAATWQSDRVYEDFEMKKLTGSLLTKIITDQRTRFKNVWNVRTRGTGYEAAKSKHPHWKLAWNTFSREHQFQKEFTSETPLPTNMQQPLANAAPETQLSVDSSISDLQSENTTRSELTFGPGQPLKEPLSTAKISITNGLSPVGQQRANTTKAKDAKVKLEEMQMETQRCVQRMTADFSKTSAELQTHLSLSNRLLAHQLSLIKEQPFNLPINE